MFFMIGYCTAKLGNKLPLVALDEKLSKVEKIKVLNSC